MLTSFGTSRFPLRYGYGRDSTTGEFGRGHTIGTVGFGLMGLVVVLGFLGLVVAHCMPDTLRPDRYFDNLLYAGDESTPALLSVSRD